MNPTPRYPHFDSPAYPQFEQDILAFWEREGIFQRSIQNRADAPAYTFYEGPPSANGTPGIHHVMARTIKDIFCRYNTQRGRRVDRKAGWDTHGLPIELQVEKKLGITKQDIGTKISVAEYNRLCRESVMEFKQQWDDLTTRMGYWVDLQDPYVTYHNEYIESCWHLLKRLFDKDLLYKGYTIQPYSPAAGTGLSTHELNQPGCYRPVKDTSVVAMFKVTQPSEALASLLPSSEGPGAFILAWTTTPWTLPSNAALAVGEKIRYSVVQTFNPYTAEPQTVVLASDRLNAYFTPEGAEAPMERANGDKGTLPYRVLGELTGKELVGTRYEQLFDYVTSKAFFNDDIDTSNLFSVVAADFVTTEDGTGIVHIAPTFGSDDRRVAQMNSIPDIMTYNTAPDENPYPDNIVKYIMEVPVGGEITDDYSKAEFGDVEFDGYKSPLVDKQGKFVMEVTASLLREFYHKIVEASESKYIQDIWGELTKLPDIQIYVRKEYSDNPNYPDSNEIITLVLRARGQAFKIEKYEHNYPHCWRTDKPVLYYPLDSWFIRTTAAKERMVELNKTINWKPAGTGTGRFGHWLENLSDWNLSRSRYWGTPLPIWVNEDRTEVKCIGSIDELRKEIDDAVAHGVMHANPLGSIGGPTQFDLHRPWIDDITLIDSKIRPMHRELDLIDVWFDSGAMPYAQWHYPFENEEVFARNFPADFIAEGVDQTRGWFFTLHAIAVMLEDNVAFKNVIANGLVLDKDGNKMAKRLGNAVNPFVTIEKYGADSTRWYMVENAPPWEDLRFNENHLAESQRKFFNTLFYTYQFFETYANIDGWPAGPAANNLGVIEGGANASGAAGELDRWVLSALYAARDEATAALDDYDPTRAARAIEDFVTEQLSNWYVRLSRRQFWKGEMSPEKQAAYTTLHHCLVTVSQLMAPIAPFFADWLYRNLEGEGTSVHLTDWPAARPELRDAALERRMALAQRLASLCHGLRKKHKLKVRQPLQKIVVPILTDEQERDLAAIAPLLANEVNVLEVKAERDPRFLSKGIKPNFKVLAPKVGPGIKALQAAIQALPANAIAQLEETGSLDLPFIADPSDGRPDLYDSFPVGYTLTREDVEITVQDIPGYYTATEAGLTVALDITLTDELRQMGLARDLVNRVQNLRKDRGLEVTDRIRLWIECPVAELTDVVANQSAYICDEVLAVELNPTSPPTAPETVDIDGLGFVLGLEKV